MTDRPTGGPAIAIAWECLSNFTRDDAFTARLTLRNVGREPIAPGWTLCFNTCRKILPATVSAGFRATHLNGDLFAFSMPDSAAWLPGQAYEIVYESLHWAISITDAPLGFYLRDAAGLAFDLGDPVIAPFTRLEQRHRMRGDLLPTADAAWRFEQDAALTLLPQDEVGRITPRPRLARFDARRCRLGQSTPIDGATLEYETVFLRSLLATLPEEEDGARVALETDPALEPEAYLLEIAPDRVLVRGAGAHGVFNGLQSLAQLLAPDGTLPCGRVVDTPRFAYRGMMLDVARHFSSVDTVLRLLDCMASYKLNRFHFHLTDDEGWRLAIAALPELTEVGARRGVPAPGEPPCLPPSFGSGADTRSPAGSGFYTADEFVAILRHAQRLHIEVIPEFNMPGHARAAVEAMRVRHARLTAAGDAAGAEEYLLSDPDDASSYESVQLWHDNVMCIALPSVDRFIDTVVAEVAALYRRAGVPLRVLHTGGDEVPVGAWLRSPACQARMRERGWIEPRQLRDDFQARCRAILARHGIGFTGWEETALTSSSRQGGEDVYVWNNGWGSGQEDCANLLANAGYQVVLSSAASLYFDFAYAKHPQEPGYYWAGFVDTREPFGLDPLEAPLLPPHDAMGRAPDPARMAALAPLDADGRARIKGLQGQLWGENARSRERVEYLALPRLIGLAERAWSADPGWKNADGLAQDWNEFANRLGQRELPRLDRLPAPWHYRLPPPGAVVKEGRLHANIALPGLAVHYTLDGSEPGADSPRYTAPVALDGCSTLKLASVDTRGRASRIVTLNLEPS
ncbi:family 20 glycosylhydrolase [Telluria beijingensis]|uniref:family 20 glycosylhydrolase n=1 Tax=Telluria beijingensis TaxID=3068633 RepID=UPI002795313D|nr:family 20 glycosylhydrolase [Massilia sp. REN29]